MADFHLIWQSPDRCQGVAIFDVEPRGAASCILELPKECRLVHASNESIPAQLTSLKDNQWRLTFESRRLPQRIELVYEATLIGGMSRRLRLQPPRLVGLEVARALWTVYGAPAAGLGRVTGSGKLTTAAEQENWRLKSISTLVQLSAEVVAEHLPEEIVRWYHPWKSRYEASRVSLDQSLASGQRAQADAEAESDIRDMDKQVLAVDARFATASPQIRSGVIPLASTELLSAARANLLATRCAVEGKSFDLELQYSRGASAGYWPRFLTALAIVLAASLLAILLHGRLLPRFAPAAVLTGAGLLWWLFLCRAHWDY